MNNPKQNRGRHRNNARRSNPSRQNFDSNGPGVRVRGNATQIYEKYIQLARDAQSAGDRVMAENMLQHAEHYFRVLNENNPDRGREQANARDQASEPQPDVVVEEVQDQAAQSGEGEDGADQTQERGNGRGRRPRNGGGRGQPRRRNGRNDGDAGGASAESTETGGAEVHVEQAAQSELPINAD